MTIADTGPLRLSQRQKKVLLTALSAQEVSESREHDGRTLRSLQRRGFVEPAWWRVGCVWRLTHDGYRVARELAAREGG